MTKADKGSGSAQHRVECVGDEVASSGVKPASKLQCLAALLVRDEGATLDHMIAATGWLPHTTRAAMTGLRKKGYVIDSDKLGGVRTYRAVAPQ
jgi:hypothetical protein